MLDLQNSSSTLPGCKYTIIIVIIVILALFIQVVMCIGVYQELKDVEPTTILFIKSAGMPLITIY